MSQDRHDGSSTVPSFRLLRPASYRVMPWKNGLGTTTEIAVHPPGSAIDDFTWRLSIADLGASGPFSTFAGYDRLLVQIEGAPMTLSHEGGGEHRLQPLVPYRFAGELGTHGTLDAPPARDFNVMVRRARASAEVSVHTLATGASARTEGEGTTPVVHVLRGAVSVRAGGARGDVAGGETLVASEETPLVLTATAEDTVAFLITIGPPRTAAKEA